MYAVVGDLDRFNSSVYGAECFIRYWPKILTVGVPVKWFTINGKEFLYILDVFGDVAGISAFFDKNEVKSLALFD